MERLLRDSLIVAVWVLSYWIAARVVGAKDVDPRPYEAVKVMGPIGVVAALFVRPVGLGSHPPGSAKPRMLLGAIAATFVLTFLLVMGVPA